VSYIITDDRPALPLIMLVDDTAWTILCAIQTNNLGVATTYISPSATYEDFLQVLAMLLTQNLTKSIVLTNQVVLSVLPLIAQAYTNKAVPAGMHMTLKASVNGYSGNANVNSFNATDTMLQNLNISSLATANSLTLTITP